MALSKNLEDLLKLMSPEDAKAQRGLWESNPNAAKNVDTFFVPQAEFSRQLALKDEEVKKANTTASEWKAWADKNKPKHEELLTEHEKLQRSYDELKKTVKTAAGEGGSEVDPEKLSELVLARVAGKTVTLEQLQEVTKQEKQNLLTEMGTLLDTTRKDFLEKTFPQTVAFQSELLEVMQDHREEFKEKLNREDLSKYMQENRITSPRKAYDEMVSGRREKIRVDTEVEKRVNEEMAKRNIPGVTQSGSSPDDIGPLQLKIAGKTPTFPDNTGLGDLSAAALAAKEMRAEGTI